MILSHKLSAFEFANFFIKGFEILIINDLGKQLKKSINHSFDERKNEDKADDLYNDTIQLKDYEEKKIYPDDQDFSFGAFIYDVDKNAGILLHLYSHC